MTFAARLIEHELAPIDLGALLEQLQHVAVELFGRGARVSLDGPAQPNAPWIGRVFSSAQAISASGATAVNAALELARQAVRDPRASGIESLELRRIVAEDVR